MAHFLITTATTCKPNASSFVTTVSIINFKTSELADPPVKKWPIGCFQRDEIPHTTFCNICRHSPEFSQIFEPHYTVIMFEVLFLKRAVQRLAIECDNNAQRQSVTPPISARLPYSHSQSQLSRWNLQCNVVVVCVPWATEMHWSYVEGLLKYKLILLRPSHSHTAIFCWGAVRKLLTHSLVYIEALTEFSKSLFMQYCVVKKNSECLVAKSQHQHPEGQ